MSIIARIPAGTVNNMARTGIMRTLVTLRVTHIERGRNNGHPNTITLEGDFTCTEIQDSPRVALKIEKLVLPDETPEFETKEAIQHGMNMVLRYGYDVRREGDHDIGVVINHGVEFPRG